jgi:hypothetical protein
MEPKKGFKTQKNFNKDPMGSLDAYIDVHQQASITSITEKPNRYSNAEYHSAAFGLSVGPQKMNNEFSLNNSMNSGNIYRKEFFTRDGDLNSISASRIHSINQKPIHIYKKLEKRSAMEILARDTYLDSSKPLWTSSKVIINQKGCEASLALKMHKK